MKTSLYTSDPLYKTAQIILILAASIFVISTIGLSQQSEPFYSYYFLFVWLSYIGFVDSWLYIKIRESICIAHFKSFMIFLVPLSVLVWFIFEAFNFRVHNWYYEGGSPSLIVSWIFRFIAFGTVLPSIFLTANLLNYLGAFPVKNSTQVEKPFSKITLLLLVLSGAMMLVLPLIFPRYFYGLIWLGFIFLLDPINANWGSISLIQEWLQNNWNRTLQLMLAGLICGFLWEIWNNWAGTKWVYTFPLPEFLYEKLGAFEMPLLGFLGFLPFALECFVIMIFANNVRQRVSKSTGYILVLCALLFILAVNWGMDQFGIS